VAGTHGKTTTTSMIIWILVQAGLDPTFIVGGVIDALDTNARAGSGPHFVIEADEYDRMFLGLRPTVAVVTHLEHDHPDCYPTFAEMKAAFEQFVDLVPSQGLIVGCGDQPTVASLLRSVDRTAVLSCGIGSQNDWSAAEIWPNPLGGHDVDVFRMEKPWGSFRLQVPGVHNVRNALVAAAVADWVGIESGVISQALQTFSGVKRRFQVSDLGTGVTVVDDYGHHPTEIRATLAAARSRYGHRPLWAVFQPHTYSRIKALWGDFVNCFVDADHVIVLDVYASRETKTLGVSAADLAAQIHHPDVRYVAGFDAAAGFIVAHAEPDAVIITFSAGDGNRVGSLVLDQWPGGQGKRSR
jgi:UDP-N-acetylmuramate--alanine ligase